MMSVQQSITEKLTKEFKVLKVVGFINPFYTLISVCIFSILFSIHFLRC